MAAELDFAHDYYTKRIAALRAAAPALEASESPEMIRFPTVNEIVVGRLWPFLVLWIGTPVLLLWVLLAPQSLVPCGLARSVPEGAVALTE